MSFFSTGDQVVDVALPTCRLRGTRAPALATRWSALASGARAVSRGPRLPSTRSRGLQSAVSGPAALLLPQRHLPDERALAVAHEPPEPHLVRRVPLGINQALAAAVEVHVDEQQPGFDARDVEREHARSAGCRTPCRARSARPRPGARRPARSRSRIRGRPCSRCARSARGPPRSRRASCGST